MKKKSELTEPEIFYIINSDESDADIAAKVDCSKRVVTGIRAKNPKPVEQSAEFKPLTFSDLTRRQSQNGKSNVFVMSEATSHMGDDANKLVPQKGDERTPKLNPDYVTTIKK